MTSEEWLRRAIEQRPWEQALRELQMSTQKWKLILPAWVEIDRLVPTQRQVGGKRKPSAISHDEYPHVVSWGRILFVEDGHTRLARALDEGQQGHLVRIFLESPRLEGQVGQ